MLYSGIQLQAIESLVLVWLRKRFCGFCFFLPDNVKFATTIERSNSFTLQEPLEVNI